MGIKIQSSDNSLSLERKIDIRIQDRDKSLSKEKDKKYFLREKLEALEKFHTLSFIECKIATHPKGKDSACYDISLHAHTADHKEDYHAKVQGIDFFHIAQEACQALENQLQKDHDIGKKRRRRGVDL